MNKLKNYSKDICFFLFLLLIIWVAASSYDFGWSGGNMKEWNLIKILVDIFIKPKLIQFLRKKEVRRHTSKKIF